VQLRQTATEAQPPLGFLGREEGGPGIAGAGGALPRGQPVAGAGPADQPSRPAVGFSPGAWTFRWPPVSRMEAGLAMIEPPRGERRRG